MKKEQKEIVIQNLDPDYFDGEIDLIIEKLVRFKEGGYDKIIIDVNQELYDDSYVEIQVIGYRQETDKEFEVRQNNLAKAELRKHLEEEQKRVQRQELYLKLKSEFEDGSEDKIK